MTPLSGEGIYENVPEALYHSDPCERPSASSSVLKTLVERSPMHARWEHPRLNPEWERSESTPAQIDGTILHSMILGTPPPYHVLDFDAFRTKEAKAARDAVVADGKIPILAEKLEPLLKVAHALTARIVGMPEVACAIAAAQKEVTLIWTERGSPCRCRFDLLPPASFGFALDLKFTSRSAEPEGWDRTLVNQHLFQAALYPRAVQTLRGDRPEFRFLVCETDPPYGVSLHAMDPTMEDLANRKVDRALAIWRRCMATGEWPGYSTEVHYHEPPPWETARWQAREYRDNAVDSGQYGRLMAAAEGPIR